MVKFGIRPVMKSKSLAPKNGDSDCKTLQDTDPCQKYELLLNNRGALEAGTCIHVLINNK